MKEALIAVPEPTFDVPRMVAAMMKLWPGARVSEEDWFVSVGWARSDDEFLELAFHPDGRGVGLDGEGRELAAEAIAWLVQQADVSPEAGVVLVQWAPDFVHLDRTTTAEALVASAVKW